MDANGFFVAVAEFEPDRGSSQIVFFSQFSFQIAFVRPVKELRVVSEHCHGRRILTSLRDVAQLGMLAFQPSWRMFSDYLGDPLIKLPSQYLRIPIRGDVTSQIVNLSNVLPGLATCEYQRCPSDMLEAVGNLRSQLVTRVGVLFGSVPFADNNYQTFA